ncbi:MAG: hypothetical protein EOO29_53555, partial [Comamonadaceae bacterium]
MTFVSRLGRIIGLLGLAAVLAACSAIKLGYNTLDDVAYWWLDSYVDFTDEQASRVREDLGRLHQWHRATQLPQFATMLASVEHLAAGDVTPAQACTVFAQLRERLDAVAQRAEPAVVTLATSLSADQLAHLERRYEKNNADYRKNWMLPPKPEQVDKRFTQFLERSEMVYGKLEEPQRKVLRTQLEGSAFDPRKVLAERQRRQRDLLQTLRRIAGVPVSFEEARGLLRGYLDRVREPPDAPDRAYQRALINEGCAIFATLHNSTTATQREGALRRLRAYQRDLRELTA